MTVWLWLAGLLFLHTIFGVFLAACISYFDMLVSNRVSDYAHNKWNCLDERVYTLCSACVFVCVCVWVAMSAHLYHYGHCKFGASKYLISLTAMDCFYLLLLLPYKQRHIVYSLSFPRRSRAKNIVAKRRRAAAAATSSPLIVTARVHTHRYTPDSSAHIKIFLYYT